MNRIFRIALCGLCLASAFVGTPVRAQETFNPDEALAKIATPAQKKKLDSLKKSLDEKIVARLGGMQAGVTQKLYALAMGPTYQPQFTEAEKLSEPEQSEKKKELWAKVSEELRPATEKEIAATLRTLIVAYLGEVEKTMTAAQKPKFQKIKTRVMASLDKEVASAATSVYTSFVPKTQ